MPTLSWRPLRLRNSAAAATRAVLTRTLSSDHPQVHRFVGGKDIPAEGSEESDGRWVPVAVPVPTEASAGGVVTTPATPTKTPPTSPETLEDNTANTANTTTTTDNAVSLRSDERSPPSERSSGGTSGGEGLTASTSICVGNGGGEASDSPSDLRTPTTASSSARRSSRKRKVPDRYVPPELDGSSSKGQRREGEGEDLSSSVDKSDDNEEEEEKGKAAIPIAAECVAVLPGLHPLTYPPRPTSLPYGPNYRRVSILRSPTTGMFAVGFRPRYFAPHPKGAIIHGEVAIQCAGLPRGGRLCPGDIVLSINGVFVYDWNFDVLLGTITSTPKHYPAVIDVLRQSLTPMPISAPFQVPVAVPAPDLAPTVVTVLPTEPPAAPQAVGASGWSEDPPAAPFVRSSYLETSGATLLRPRTGHEMPLSIRDEVAAAMATATAESKDFQLLRKMKIRRDPKTGLFGVVLRTNAHGVAVSDGGIFGIPDPLMMGDVVLSVNGVNVSGWIFEDVVALIKRTPRQSLLILDVLRSTPPFIGEITVAAADGSGDGGEEERELARDRSGVDIFSTAGKDLKVGRVANDKVGPGACTNAEDGSSDFQLLRNVKIPRDPRMGSFDIIFGTNAHGIVVSAVGFVPGSSSRLMRGDVVSSVNGVNVSKWIYKDVRAQINRTPKQSSLILDVLRPAVPSIGEIRAAAVDGACNDAAKKPKTAGNSTAEQREKVSDRSGEDGSSTTGKDIKIPRVADDKFGLVPLLNVDSNSHSSSSAAVTIQPPLIQRVTLSRDTLGKFGINFMPLKKRCNDTPSWGAVVRSGKVVGSALAPLCRGDVIKSINDTDVSNWSFARIIALVKGTAKGCQLILDVVPQTVFSAASQVTNDIDPPSPPLSCPQSLMAKSVVLEETGTDIMEGTSETTVPSPAKPSPSSKSGVPSISQYEASERVEAKILTNKQSAVLAAGLIDASAHVRVVAPSPNPEVTQPRECGFIVGAGNHSTVSSNTLESLQEVTFVSVQPSTVVPVPGISLVFVKGLTIKHNDQLGTFGVLIHELNPPLYGYAAAITSAIGPLCEGDAVASVNGANVSNNSLETVAKLIRAAPKTHPLLMSVLRLIKSSPTSERVGKVENQLMQQDQIPTLQELSPRPHTNMIIGAHGYTGNTTKPKAAAAVILPHRHNQYIEEHVGHGRNPNKLKVRQVRALTSETMPTEEVTAKKDGDAQNISKLETRKLWQVGGQGFRGRQTSKFSHFEPLEPPHLLPGSEVQRGHINTTDPITAPNMSAYKSLELVRAISLRRHSQLGTFGLSVRPLHGPCNGQPAMGAVVTGDPPTGPSLKILQNGDIIASVNDVNVCSLRYEYILQLMRMTPLGYILFLNVFRSSAHTAVSSRSAKYGGSHSVMTHRSSIPERPIYILPSKKSPDSVSAPIITTKMNKQWSKQNRSSSEDSSSAYSVYSETKEMDSSDESSFVSLTEEDNTDASSSTESFNKLGEGEDSMENEALAHDVGEDTSLSSDDNSCFLGLEIAVATAFKSHRDNKKDTANTASEAQHHLIPKMEKKKVATPVRHSPRFNRRSPRFRE